MGVARVHRKVGFCQVGVFSMPVPDFHTPLLVLSSGKFFSNSCSSLLTLVARCCVPIE